MRYSSRLRRWPRSKLSSRVAPLPGSCQCDTSAANLGRLASSHCMRATNSGAAARVSSSSTSTANIGIKPTIVRTFQQLVAAFGRVEGVVVKLIFAVPEVQVGFAHVGHGLSDVEEVLEKLARHVLVHRIGLAQLQRDAHHVQGKHGHPGRAIGLLEVAA
nr:hypothetical protein [Tanacetum cinerariifolium]